MAKQRKNTYRLSFLIDGNQRELYVHTQAEKASVQLHVKRLISSRRTGAPCLESEEWAAELPRNSNVREFLIRWRLIEATATGMTLADLRDEFINRPQEERTVANHRTAFKSLVTYFGEGCLLSDIDKRKVKEFIDFLKREGNARTGEGLSEGTLYRLIKRFRQFFTFAVNEKWIFNNPFEGIKTSGSPANSDNWLYVTKEDTIRVIEATPNKAHKLIVALMRFCGLRGASELSRLSFNDFHSSTAERPAELIVHSTKNERHAGHEQRKIPLTPFVEQLILDLWESIPEGENRFFPQMRKKSNPGIIVKKAFKRFKDNGVEIGEDIKLGKPYNLRRSYVTDLMMGGMHEADPAMFEKLAGHSLKMSLTHYQILTEKRKENAAQKFLEIMGTTPGENSTTYFTTYSLHNLRHRDGSQHLAKCNNESRFSLENKGYSQENRTPCEITQGVPDTQGGGRTLTTFTVRGF